MRSKMLGLAIALSTFGLGVAATTVWIAYHTPNVPARETLVATRIVEVPVLNTVVRASDAVPCTASHESDGTTLPVLKGGVLQGKAISRPQPRYPEEARAESASGSVVLFVVINECGNVETARVVSGHPLLQRAALDAVMGWHYSPTLVGGKPVKVSGTVTFNFLLQ